MNDDSNGPAVAAASTDVPERRSPLAQLSELVGHAVADVRRVTRYRHERGPGVNQPLGWSLIWARGGRSLTVESHELRREDRLNEVALTHWRRPLDLPRLTGDDGRRLIRLLHEVIESKSGTTTEEIR